MTAPMPSQCPRITTVVQTGRHLEVEFECCGRSWVRAYLSGGRVPMIEPRADGKGLTLEQAQILSIALQMACDWGFAEAQRAEKKKQEAITGV